MNRPSNEIFVLQWSHHRLTLGRRTLVMGVLNVTPDSFSDGGRFFSWERAVEQGLRMAWEGADILDVGGESTRPYAKEVSEQEELERVIPVIESLRRELRLPVSIDTLKAGVAAAALRAGASMVNDVSAFRFDPELARVTAEAGVPVVLMHMKGTPRDMQKHPTYEDLLSEIISFLKDAADRATRAGVREDLIILDPGIGFGKTFDHNLLILRELGKFSSLGRPLMVGPSRKAFLGGILNKEAPERDTGTMAAVAAAALGGAHIVRVHNVGMAVETVKVIDAIKRGQVKEIDD